MSFEATTPGPTRGRSAATNRVVCEICAVRGHAVCGALDDAELPALSSLATSRKLEAGQTLFHEGDAADSVFSLTSGTVKLFKLLSDGRRQITGFLLPGDFLGLAFLKTYAYSAEAVTAATLCRFSRQRFNELLETYPSLDLELLGRASSELAAAQEQMLLLGRKTSRERLATFLIRLAARQSVAIDEPVHLAMSRTDIADYLGLTIETVSRTFTMFKTEGLIGLPDKHTFTVLDSQELARCAGS